MPGKKFIAVGEKSYAVESAAATGTTLAGDIAVRQSSRLARGVGCVPGPTDAVRSREASTCRRISRRFCGRYYINS